MEMSERKPLLSHRVLYLPTDALHPNPHQPRRDFDEGALRELSESIRRYGILQPLTVRRTENGYELIAAYGFSQEQAAERLGKSQSAVANKLRLLRLSPPCVRLLRENGLSERHARALLRLADEEDRLHALRTIIARGCNVAQSERYIEQLLAARQKTPPPRLPTYVIKDVRIFLNTIRRSIDVMQRAGVQADVQRQDSEEDILLTIRIPKRAKEAG